MWRQNDFIATGRQKNISLSGGHPLAYVFWHWARPEIPVQSYEAKLASFLRGLSSDNVPGLMDALSFRVGPLPWGPPDAGFYEDWYVVKDFTSLGALNDGAITGSAGTAHDSIVKDFMKGTGSVFRLVSGGLPLRESHLATWTEKPIGPSYQSYYDELTKATAGIRTDVWRRQLALGPSQQFCIHSVEPLQVPRAFSPLTSGAELVC
jgi:hypothetical protein